MPNEELTKTDPKKSPISQTKHRIIQESTKNQQPHVHSDKISMFQEETSCAFEKSSHIVQVCTRFDHCTGLGVTEDWE